MRICLQSWPLFPTSWCRTLWYAYDGMRVIFFVEENEHAKHRVWLPVSTKLRLSSPRTTIDTSAGANACRTPNYWTASCGKMSVYRGTLYSRRSVLGPSENLKDRLGFCSQRLSSLVCMDLLESTNCENKIQIVAIQYSPNSRIASPTVCQLLVRNL